jgi:hypothetical protein
MGNFSNLSQDNWLLLPLSFFGAFGLGQFSTVDQFEECYETSGFIKPSCPANCVTVNILRKVL